MISTRNTSKNISVPIQIGPICPQKELFTWDSLELFSISICTNFGTSILMHLHKDPGANVCAVTDTEESQGTAVPMSRMGWGTQGRSTPLLVLGMMGHFSIRNSAPILRMHIAGSGAIHRPHNSCVVCICCDNIQVLHTHTNTHTHAFTWNCHAFWGSGEVDLSPFSHLLVPVLIYSHGGLEFIERAYVNVALKRGSDLYTVRFQYFIMKNKIGGVLLTVA